MGNKEWQVGTTRYRLNQDLWDITRKIQVKRCTAFDKAITDARVRKAANEFGAMAVRTEKLIEIDIIGMQSIEEVYEALDEFLTVLDRIVTGREAGIAAQDARSANVARSRARKAAARSGFYKEPLLARAKH